MIRNSALLKLMFVLWGAGEAQCRAVLLMLLLLIDDTGVFNKANEGHLPPCGVDDRRLRVWFKDRKSHDT